VVWQLQTAKQKFSELIDRVLEDGPQVITRHGKEVAVVVAIDEYRRLSGPTPDFKRFLREGPGIHELDLQRDEQLPRDVELPDLS
jgi:prevent-host-death family protein